ncbi:type II toxin-antitoxin system RatA family toxin [Silanimonas sp.]|jgi:ribosome-associated toxin RatA of RatAB toxin-antitoxin module|uniref:type II toxin-antitoxin system RatA family toxin n=1 Tax=Silanimonas sp. TaxID=1929290 RepID=UPI0022C4871A|nr:type II toxin-antitoxin system RatA family toxin [Silanimonas sp.]MCZ8167308.1 type II toxin-antitoxin system RatA family toxin [Silanimonas sp.]
MTRIQRHALVMHSASRMFHLVNEVEGYPRWFGWCEQAAVLERSADTMVARLDLKIAGLRTNFTTRNRWVEPTRLELQLVDGPFRKLEGHWTFHALDEEACKVSLNLDFDVAGALVGNALALGFQGLADRLVDDFCRIANTADRGRD